MRLSTLLILASMAIVLAALLALGTWQVQRLKWKEELIARVEARLASAPTDLLTLKSTGFSKAEHEYQPVRVTGTFDHSKEVYFFATGKSGRSGWHVHTPLLLDENEAVIVNRGFVPFEMRNASTRQAGQTSGTVTVSGLLRFPLQEKPFSSYENDLEERNFYWRNVPQMAQLMDGSTGEPLKFLPVIVDAQPDGVEGGWPQGGTTIIEFPNNHLQYAITWYGLALALLGVGSYFLYARRNQDRDRQDQAKAG